ncbi:MAG: YggS family pyridoxal phosphate-dependent enzyme [Alphaproteobacteria bacterium]|nr:YggS family pyridoxal phosphate-dependent enzyme [Alphaproteobacteria bacterium]
MANDLQSSPNDPPAAVGEKILALRAEVEIAASRLRLAKAPPVLVAVTKKVPEAAIREALETGQRVFGENRVQEAAEKWPALRDAYPDIELHLIGPLQTNKVKQAIGLFDVIETLDRPKLAKALARERNDGARLPRLFVQVNTGEEAQKAGVLPAETGAFLALCRNELGLVPEGLMCVPPVEEEAALHFALLHEIARANALEGLSMGMSGDYETALNFGASHVRLGTAIFGPRGEA